MSPTLLDIYRFLRLLHLYCYHISEIWRQRTVHEVRMLVSSGLGSCPCCCLIRRGCSHRVASVIVAATTKSATSLFFSHVYNAGDPTKDPHPIHPPPNSRTIPPAQRSTSSTGTRWAPGLTGTFPRRPRTRRRIFETTGFLIFYPQSRFLVGLLGCGVLRFYSVYEVRASVEGRHLQTSAIRDSENLRRFEENDGFPFRAAYDWETRGIDENFFFPRTPPPRSTSSTGTR